MCEQEALGALRDFIENGSETEQKIAFELVCALCQSRINRNLYDPRYGEITEYVVRLDDDIDSFDLQFGDVEWLGIVDFKASNVAMAGSNKLGIFDHQIFDKFEPDHVTQYLKDTRDSQIADRRIKMICTLAGVSAVVILVALLEFF